MKHKSLLIIILLLMGVVTIFAQVTGDYRSSATGNWSDYTKWQRYNGSSWVAATSGQIPDENASVYVQSGHVVTLTQAEKCKDLHIAKGTSASNATNGRVQLATYSLELYGKLRTYYAAIGTVPGTSTNIMANMLITCTGANGKLVVKGSSNRTLTTSTEWTDGTFTAPPTGQLLFNMEIAPDSGVVINMEATIRAYSWNIVSGTLNVANSAIVHADRNVVAEGDVTVGVNAVIVANANTSTISFIRRSSGFRGGTFTLNGLLRVMGTDTAIAMSSVILNGTVEYAANAAQNFIKNGGDGAVVPSPCNDVVLSGSGTKTLATNVTINQSLTRTGTASLALSTFALTYGANAHLIYSGAATQTTANTEWPATGGPHIVTIANDSGVTLNSAKTIAGDLYLHAGNLAMGAYALSVQGTTFVNNGASSGGTGYTDGYNDVVNKYFKIDANDINMTGFTSSTAIGSHYPDKTDREWVISATFTGNKTLTLYWTSSDDHNYDWVGLGQVPSVYLGGTEYVQTGYDVVSDPRSVTVSLSSFAAKGNFLVGVAGDVTLPVELSSFSAVLTADFFVKLHWTTQSETSVSGFYVYRGLDSDIANAVVVSPMLEPHNTADQQHYEYIDNELYESATYYYWLAVQNMDGGVDYHGPTTVYYSNTGNQGAPGIPVVSGLQSIYPNPFNPTATISYGLKDASDVNFTIYNVRGQLIRNFSDGQKAAGNWKVFWNGLDNNGNTCSTGVYYIKMQAGKDSFMRKAVLMK